MEKYKLAFDRWDEHPYSFDIKEFAIFYVSNGPILFPVAIEMVRTLYSILTSSADTPKRLSQSELRYAMLTLALPKLRAKLSHLDAPTTLTSKILLKETFTSEHLDLFTRGTPTKCQFQERTAVGIICRAAMQNDEFHGKTSLAICAACDLPKDPLRCTNLQHPEVIGTTSATGAGRHVVSAFCDSKTTSFSWCNCIPGGNSCWEQEIDNSEKNIEVMEDIAERMVDELQYLNLAFRHVFGNALLRINDLRSVSQILTPCHTQEEFTTKVACLADIFNNI